jgi:hypothetical protein
MLGGRINNIFRPTYSSSEGINAAAVDFNGTFDEPSSILPLILIIKYIII